MSEQRPSLLPAWAVDVVGGLPGHTGPPGPPGPGAGYLVMRTTDSATITGSTTLTILTAPALPAGWYAFDCFILLSMTIPGTPGEWRSDGTVNLQWTGKPAGMTWQALHHGNYMWWPTDTSNGPVVGAFNLGSVPEAPFPEGYPIHGFVRLPSAASALGLQIQYRPDDGPRTKPVAALAGTWMRLTPS